jgi:DNA polymerase III alpha subunit
VRREEREKIRLPELLDGGAEGLYCVVEGPGLARKLADVVPRDNLKLELATPGRPSSAWERAVAAAKELGAGVVATGEAWFGAPEDWVLHRALRAVAGKTLVQRAGGEDGVANPNAYMASPKQMARRLGRYAWALDESLKIAESCNLEIENREHIFPFCDLQPGQTPRGRLAAMCAEGMRARYGASPPRWAAARLRRELEVIDRLGFSPYFIIVGEIVAWARGRGISSLGRGSGASSLAAYLLGITGVDPLRYGLCFERFLNSNRPDYPDLDVDLCWRRRDEVIDHVYETYGRDRVAMISTHVTFQRRSALREMAKVWGLAPDDVLKAMREWGRAGEREGD